MEQAFNTSERHVLQVEWQLFDRSVLQILMSKYASPHPLRAWPGHYLIDPSQTSNQLDVAPRHYHLNPSVMTESEHPLFEGELAHRSQATEA